MFIIKNNIIKFINDVLLPCYVFKEFDILNKKTKEDVAKWYIADKEYNDSTFNNKSIPWPVVDIVKLNIMRYGKDEPELTGVLYYLDILKKKYNNCL